MFEQVTSFDGIWVVQIIRATRMHCYNLKPFQDSINHQTSPSICFQFRQVVASLFLLISANPITGLQLINFFTIIEVQQLNACYNAKLYKSRAFPQPATIVWFS